MNLVASLRTLGWALTALLACGSWGHAYQASTTKTLSVLVADGLSGDPIAGAPVQLIGEPYLLTTDTTGRVEFTQIALTTQSVRLWTTPIGYSPGFREVSLPSRVNVAMLTPVPEDRFSTGLITAAIGGSYVLSGTVGPDMESFYMEIDVPPNALSQDASISITPYPTTAVGSHGTDPSSYPFAGFHANLRNFRGAKIQETFAVPVTFRIKGWHLDHLHDYDGLDPEWVALYRYDYQAHEFAEEPSIITVDTVNDLVVFQLSRLSIVLDKVIPPPGTEALQRLWDWFRGDDDDDDGVPPGKGDPPSPEPEVDGPTYVCVPKPSNHPITCGVYNTTNLITIAKGTEVGMSAGLEAGIESTFGVEGGAAALAKIKGEIKAHVTVSFEGSLTASTSVAIQGGFTAGNPAGGSCYSGTVKNYIIYERYDVSAGGLVLGHFEVPTDIQPIRTLTWDTSCGAHCVEPPHGPPHTDPLPCDP